MTPIPATSRRLATALALAVSLSVAGTALLLAGAASSPHGGERADGTLIPVATLPATAGGAAPAGALGDPPPTAATTAADPVPDGGKVIEPSLAKRAAIPQPAAPTPSPTPALDPPPQEGPFEINLYRKGAFVSQSNKLNCVPSAMLTMLNIVDPAGDLARPSQDRLYRLARKLSTERLRGDGAEPEGWARGLEQLGAGPYGVEVVDTRTGALRVAARALRMSGRPVGLLVWRGAHAWVMTGFRATADPATTRRFDVTHVRVVDVWYPRVSSIWGPSVKPNTLVPVEALKSEFLGWRRPLMRYPDKDGQYVLVLPGSPTT